MSAPPQLPNPLSGPIQADTPTSAFDVDEFNYFVTIVRGNEGPRSQLVKISLLHDGIVELIYDGDDVVDGRKAMKRSHATIGSPHASMTWTIIDHNARLIEVHYCDWPAMHPAWERAKRLDTHSYDMYRAWGRIAEDTILHSEMKDSEAGAPDKRPDLSWIPPMPNEEV